MNEKLNTFLADLVVEYHKLQNFHWYVNGKDFFATHEKLEELYTYINKAIDEVAENMLMIDIKPVSSLKEFLETATIKEASTKNCQTKEVYKEVLNDFTTLSKSIKEIKVLADEQDCYIISALMDTYISYFAKTIWMLKQVNNT